MVKSATLLEKWYTDHHVGKIERLAMLTNSDHAGRRE